MCTTLQVVLPAAEHRPQAVHQQLCSREFCFSNEKGACLRSASLVIDHNQIVSDVKCWTCSHKQDGSNIAWCVFIEGEESRRVVPVHVQVTSRQSQREYRVHLGKTFVFSVLHIAWEIDGLFLCSKLLVSADCCTKVSEVCRNRSTLPQIRYGTHHHKQLLK